MVSMIDDIIRSENEIEQNDGVNDNGDKFVRPGVPRDFAEESGNYRNKSYADAVRNRLKGSRAYYKRRYGKSFRRAESYKEEYRDGGGNANGDDRHKPNGPERFGSEPVEMIAVR